MSQTEAYWRINYRTVDGGGADPLYALDYQIDGHGHLHLYDAEGRQRVLSASKDWDVCETENVPESVRAEAEDAEVLRA